MKIRLVPNWKHCHKWISVHCMTLAASIQGAWMYIPEDMRQSIPTELVTGATIFLMVIGIVGRLINQTPDKK